MLKETHGTSQRQKIQQRRPVGGSGILVLLTLYLLYRFYSSRTAMLDLGF